MSQRLAENLQTVQKCCNLISARTGKECITWRMFRTLYTPSSRRAEKNVIAFYVMRLILQSNTSRICRRCSISVMRFANVQKTDSRSCFQSAEPCDKGYLAKRKTRYAALLLDWRSANRKRTDLSDFSKTLGWPAKRSINFLSATVCFDFVCFTPACNVQQIFQSQVSCPVYETGICSDLNLSWIGTHWLSKIVPTWDTIFDCHSGKAHCIQYAFADWQSRLTTE